jgi:undecaprenyl-diphosphatase
MLEASPIFGLLIPGQMVVILGGFFAKIGILEIGDVIWVAALGAITGDLISYYLGRKYGVSFILKYGKYFLFKERYFEKTRKLMTRHLKKTLIIGRFNSLTRSFAPFVAGASDVSFLKFNWCNITGGIIWAVLFVSVGYIFGKSYEFASQYIGKFIFFAIFFSILIVYVYRFINRRKHIFDKCHLYALFVNVFSLYLFSKMIEDVVDKELITNIDIWINEKMILFWTPTLNKIMIFITSIVNTNHLLILSILLLGVLAYRKKLYNSLLLIFGISGGLFFTFVIKLIIHRARPEGSLINISGFSFPSTHAAMALIFFSVLIYSFKDNIKGRIVKNAFVFTNILLFLLIGFSRIYLGVHWLSDVIAGFSLGLFWLTLLILIFAVGASLTKKELRLTYRITDV